MIDHPVFRSASWLAVAGFVAAGVYWIGADDTGGGVALLGLAVLGGFIVHFQRVLPSSIMFLLFVAAATNAAGYVMTLWHERTLFDEVIHAFTTFAGMTALIWVAARRIPLARDIGGLAGIATALFAGLILGLVYKGFEWLTGIIGERRDTLSDCYGWPWRLRGGSHVQRSPGSARPVCSLTRSGTPSVSGGPRPGQRVMRLTPMQRQQSVRVDYFSQRTE